MGTGAVAGIGRKQPQLRVVLVFDLVDHAHVSIHQRCQLGQQQPADRGKIALALKHVCKSGEVGLEPVLLGVDIGGEPQIANHRIDVVLELRHFASGVDLDRTGEVALGDGGRHFRDRAYLRGQIGRQQVDVAGEILPRAGRAGNLCLSTQLAFGAHLARDAGHLAGESVQLIHHRVDGVLEFENFALHVDRDLARQVAARHRGGDFGDVTDLSREVGCEQIDVVSQILPGAADAGHHGLAAQSAFGADLARDARHLGGERAKLLDHGIQGVLEQQDFTTHVDRDLLGQVAARDRGRHLGDVANLRGQIRRHEVDVVGEVLPGAGDAGHVGLTAKAAFGSDLARHARHLTGEPVELIDHGIERLLELQDLAAHVHRDLAGKVAAGDRGRNLGDVADLRRQVAGHRIDAVRQVLPGAGNAGHFGLTAKLAVGTDFARDPRHFAGESVELVDHRVQRFLQLKNFARHVHRDLFRQVALGHRGRDFGDVADLAGQVAGHRVHAVGQILPCTGNAAHQRLAAQFAFGADLARDARHFAGEGVELVDHGVDGVFQFENLAAHVHRDLLGKVSVGDRGGHFGDVSHLSRQIARHRVDALGQILPGAGDAEHVGLAAQPAFGADFTGDAGDFRRKRVELIDHRVDGVLELQDFTTHVHRDFARKVAAGDRGRDVGDIAYLRGQVAAHRVHGVGQVLPGAGDAGHDRLAAQLAVGTDFAGDARDFGREGAKLIHHGVDGFLQLQDFAADVHRDFLGQVAVGDGDGDLGDVSNLAGEIVGHGIDALGQVLPDARHLGDLRLAAEF